MINPFTRYLLVPCFLLTIVNFTTAQTSPLDSLQAVLKTLPADTNRVNTLIEICKIHSSSNTEKMEQTAREALSLAQEIHFGKGEAFAAVYLARYYHNTGNAPRAVEFLLKALRYFEKAHDIQRVAMCFNNIGVIYLNQEDLKEALDNFQKAYAAWSSLKYKSGVVRALYNIGSVYEKQKKDSPALDYYTRALKLCEEIQDKSFTSQILNSIGMAHLRLHAYDTAMMFQERALQLAREVENVTLQAQCYGAMSEIYAAGNQPEKALVAAEKSVENALKVTSKDDLLDSYRQLYQAHEKLNNYRKAYEFQSLYVALNDSLKNSENLGAIEKLKSRYELDKKEAEIILLTQRHEVEDFRRNVFIAALAGLLFISFLLYSRYRLITKRKLALRKQQLDFYIQSLMEKSETIHSINLELESFKTNSSEEEEVRIARIDRILQSHILTDKDWENFKKAFEEIYPAFFARLRYKYPAITVSELRLSALIKLNLSIKEAATMLGISPESVKTSRYRLKKKFGLSENESVEDFIKKLELPSLEKT
jgi:DNA-binding CsgD family transcriptional regulator